MKTYLYNYFKKIFSQEIDNDLMIRNRNERYRIIKEFEDNGYDRFDNILTPINVSRNSIYEFIAKEFRTGKVIILFNDDKELESLMGEFEHLGFNFIKKIITEDGEISLYFLHDRKYKGIRIINDKIKFENIGNDLYSLAMEGFKGFIIK